MTLAQAIRKLKKIKPRKFEDLIKAGFAIRYLDAGSFREVYKLSYVPMVVKFPLTDTHQTCLAHARDEIKAFRKLRRMRKTASRIQEHLPEVYYTNLEHGVIAMGYYKSPVKDRVTQKKICDVLGIDMEDLDFGPNNFGCDAAGQTVLLDLGLVAV